MNLKVFWVNVHDCGCFFEEDMNKKLKGATHVHTVNAPFNKHNGETGMVIIYAFYPSKPETEKEL